jgi:hypothetical protein
MRAFGRARERYHAHVGDDPVSAGEPATVGLLLTAAGEAGLLGLLEYPVDKRGAEGQWCYGRCDLWVGAPRHADDLGWALEVKRRRITSRSPRSRLVNAFREAWKDAGVLDPAEGTMRLACTIFYSETEIDVESDCARTLRRLGSMSDWSWRISHSGDLPPLYVFFKHRRRGRPK